MTSNNIQHAAGWPSEARYSKRSDSAEDSNNADSDPIHVQLSRTSIHLKSYNRLDGEEEDDDSDFSDNMLHNISKQQYQKARRKTQLPPIGVFWDIENCQVSKNKSAGAMVQKFRSMFFEGHREVEFLVVCDVTRESPAVIDELHNAQVSVNHVSATCKNAADEKLRQALRRFGETYSTPATVVVLTSDINFASDLNDLRYRKNFRVILIHNAMVAPALIACANEHHNFAQLTENLQADNAIQLVKQPAYLIASNLPRHNQPRIRLRLNNLIENCGGRIVKVDQAVGTALLRFGNVSSAERAQKRLKNADVCGFSIDVSNWFDAPPPKMATPAQGSHNNSLNSTQQSTSYNQHNISSSSIWNGALFDSVVQTPKTQYQNYQSNAYNDSNVQNDYTPFPRSRHNSYNRPYTPQDYDYTQSVFRNRTSSADLPRDDQAIIKAAPNNKFFRSIPKSNNYSQHVDLFITNLDPSLDGNELRVKLTNMLKQLVVIINLTILSQSDGSWAAIIRVGSQQEAKYAISQLHHCKIGYRRINISYGQATVDQMQLKEVIIALLKEVPDNSMPLFKLIELLANRYHMNISVYELTRQRDVCRVTDEPDGRIVSLTPEIRSSPIPNLTEKLPYGYCQLHHHRTTPSSTHSNTIPDIGWAEHTIRTLPNIRISLATFSSQLHAMLQLHPSTTMPLVSFPLCYRQQFDVELPVVEEDDSSGGGGVPLEHLVTCVRNVSLVGATDSGKGGKWIVWQRDDVCVQSGGAQHQGGMENGFKDELPYQGMPREIAQNTQLLCRELVDLLKTRDKCQLLLDKFIPMYHHYFGRQCRVATYGFTRLVDLFESDAISAVVHIMGTDDTVRILTLTHQAQMRRFTADVLRMLKSQVSKQVSAAEFPALFEATFNRKFNPVDYGLCGLDELLQHLPQSTFVLVRDQASGLLVTIPKKEPTKEEMEKTKRFAVEVVRLLKHSAYCKMQFNKFVPSYHHHFGHQCKVADYGFTKLIELFEAIPDIVKIEETSYGERTVSLTLPKAMEVLGGQIEEIIRKGSCQVSISSLPSLYMQEFGYPLKIDTYECKTIDELVQKLKSFVKICRRPTGVFLELANEEPSLAVALRSWSLLLIYPYHMPLAKFVNQYSTKYGCTLNPSTLTVLVNIVMIRNDKNKESYIALTPLYELAAKIYQMLYLYGGQIPYTEFSSTYQQMFGVPMRLLECGIANLEDLFVHLSFLILVRGSRIQTVIVLNQSLVAYGISMPTNSTDNNVMKELLQQWPMPPMPEVMMGCLMKRVPPPKPDTPSATSSAPWTEWDTETLDFTIALPAIRSPKMLGTIEGLYSPAKFLLPAYNPNSLGKNYSQTNTEVDFCPSVSAPEPQDIPMPDTLLVQGIVCDDSNDSGVANNSNGTSEAEESPKTSLGAKRKLNLNQNPT